MSDDRVWFVAERFEQLRDLLLEFGYALDPGPRDPNEWHELHYEEPPTGVVRLKGIRLRDLEDDDSDFDPEITFSTGELWSPDHVDGAQTPSRRCTGISRPGSTSTSKAHAQTSHTREACADLSELPSVELARAATSGSLRIALIIARWTQG